MNHQESVGRVPRDTRRVDSPGPFGWEEGDDTIWGVAPPVLSSEDLRKRITGLVEALKGGKCET